MIGKIPRPGRGFRGSFQYLMHGKRDADRDPHRLAWMETRNLFVKDPDRIPAMMRATAAQSRKCQKPVYHMIISWRPDEAVSDVTMREVADQALFDLGLNEHQAVLAAHRDTDHRHLHILVNRVHPETGKAWHTSKDWARFERSIARQALERGLLKVDGRHNSPEQMARENKRARDGEYQMIRRLGHEVPKDRWSLEEIKSRRLQLAPIFEQSRSWDQLTRLLSAEGLTLTAKGQGLVIDDSMGFMKLSDLGKNVRLAGLESLYRESFNDFAHRREIERAADVNAAVPPQSEPDRAQAPPSMEQTPTNTPIKQPLYERQIADEAEKDKVRSEWRAKRQHTRQATSDNEDDNDTTSGHLSPRRERTPHVTHGDAAPRREAWQKVMDAREKLDIARDLHRGGSIDNDHLVWAIDNHAAARDEFAQLMADEPDKSRLREEWRQQAETQREAVNSRGATRSKPADTNSSDNTAATTEAPPQREREQSQQRQAPQPPSQRLEAFRNLSHAHEQLDLARQLHGLGILSKQDLMTARDDLARAREQLAKHQTFSEFVADGVRNALTGVSKSTQQASQQKPAKPLEKKPRKPSRNRKKEQDRDR